MATLSTVISYSEPAGSLVAQLGAPGPAGQPGPPGPAGTIEVGTVTTGAPGSSANVVNVGTETAAILDFTIPRGDQGIQGIQGIPGEKGDKGDQGDPGPAGVVSATAPLAYDALTQTVSIDLSAYATETFVTSQGYITSAALTPYQTIAGMSAYAQLSGATFNGNVFAPTPSPGTDSTQIATTAWVKNFDYAPTNSPTLTGNPKSETPNLADNDTSIATTAFVKGQNYLTSSALTGYALLSGASFTGKVNFTPVSGVAGLNVGIGGTSAASTTQGDLWIATGGVNLNYRDGTGAWRIVAITTSTNTFSSPQIVNTAATTPALRVTQTGTGNAIQVEDSTTPDSTAFVVDQHGKVGIGVAPDATAALKVDTNGIMFGDDSVQTTAAVPFIYDAGLQEASLINPGSFKVKVAPTYCRVEDDVGGNTTVASYGIVFPDNTIQTTAATSGIPDCPNDGNLWVRSNGYWSGPYTNTLITVDGTSYYALVLLNP
jgi:hypothetical protein